MRFIGGVDPSRATPDSRIPVSAPLRSSNSSFLAGIEFAPQEGRRGWSPVLKRRVVEVPRSTSGGGVPESAGCRSCARHAAPPRWTTIYQEPHEGDTAALHRACRIARFRFGAAGRSRSAALSGDSPAGRRHQTPARRLYPFGTGRPDRVVPGEPTEPPDMFREPGPGAGVGQERAEFSSL